MSEPAERERVTTVPAVDPDARRVAQRRQLQVAVALAALVPLIGGAMGMAWGAGMMGEVAAPARLDSHVRYLSGLLFGLGLMAVSSVPGIERHGGRFDVIVLLVGIGGLARLWAALALGTWWSPFVFLPLAMELGVTPVLWLWQRRVARAWIAPTALPHGSD